MPTITITMSAAHLARVVAALSERYGYSPTLPDGTPNPQTKPEFVRACLMRWVREGVREHEQAAARAAVATVTDVDLT